MGRSSVFISIRRMGLGSFQFSMAATSRDVKDGSIDQIAREPEQAKGFRDT
jgi:hypothetical protein